MNHHSHYESCGHTAHDRRAHHGSFGPRGFRPPHGFGSFGAHGFGGPGSRARRGDVRTAVLLLLAEQPMHGYQIIQELSSRSGGAWSPSAGSVYPTLQLLADEGLVTAEETAGKKVFSLTEAGTAEVATLAEEPAPWDAAAAAGTAPGFREAAGKLMQAIWQIGTTGSADQVSSAIEVLTDARKKLYAILAED